MIKHGNDKIKYVNTVYKVKTTFTLFILNMQGFSERYTTKDFILQSLLALP